MMQIVDEVVMYLYMLYLLTNLTRVTSSIMMTCSESRLANSVFCRQYLDHVCSIDADSMSQKDMDSLDIPCPPPYGFIHFCDTNIGLLFTCKTKLRILEYCYNKYIHMYPAKVCVDCSCDDRCKDVNDFMINKGYLDPAYSSTTSKSPSSTFSLGVLTFVTVSSNVKDVSLSTDSTGILVTENITLPSIDKTSSDINDADITATMRMADTQLTHSQQNEYKHLISLVLIFIIEAVALIIICYYRRKYRQRDITNNRREDVETYRHSATKLSTEVDLMPIVSSVKEYNDVNKSSNAVMSEVDGDLYPDNESFKFIDDTESEV